MSRRYNGFTLIELLIVVVILGILAAIAIGKFRSVKEKAFVATMRSDLHNLTNAQETYFADSAIYYSGALPNASFGSRPSTGVALAISSVTVAGWGATATHTATATVCAVFHGAASAVPPATVNGTITCQ